MFIQDTNFNFIEISDLKIPELTRDRFIIALDFDGVITSPYELKTKYINQLGYDIGEDQCGYDACVRKLGIKKEDYETGLKKAFTEDPQKLPLEKNFLKYFKKLKQLDTVSFFIITNRTKDMLKHLEEYLKHHKIKVDGIIITEVKSKTESIEIINANIFVEDSPFKLSQIIKESEDIANKCLLILYRNTQNRIESNPSEKILEVENWQELYRVINSKTKEFFKNASNVQ
jgi:uncharacterized HAD superfamily protein